MISRGWAMATTKEGYIALVPGGTDVEDEIGLFKGGKAFFILRNTGSCWKLIGECYVHGTVYGEEFEQEKCTLVWVS